MSRIFPLHSEFFADDTKIYRELENENKSDTLAQRADIDHLTAWASWRQLCVLALTTRAEAVRICVKRQLASIRHHVTSWRQVLRLRCHYFVNVSWSEHVNVTVNKANKASSFASQCWAHQILRQCWKWRVIIVVIFFFNLSNWRHIGRGVRKLHMIQVIYASVPGLQWITNSEQSKRVKTLAVIVLTHWYVM